MSLYNYLKISLQNNKNNIINMFHKSQMKVWRFRLRHLNYIFSNIIFSSFSSLESIINQKLLMKKIPQIQNFTILEKYLNPKLRKYYKQYVSQVSNESMAISFKSSIFLISIIFIFEPKSFLDLGSGFSSFIARFYLKMTKHQFSVWSIDDSSKWLEKTRNFLNKHNLNTENMLTWKEFIKVRKPIFDFIFYDLGSMEVRKNNLIKVLNLAQTGSIVILDDIHKNQYRKYAINLLKEQKFKYYNLKYLTEDGFGRYFMLAIKK